MTTHGMTNAARYLGYSVAVGALGTALVSTISEVFPPQSAWRVAPFLLAAIGAAVVGYLAGAPGRGRSETRGTERTSLPPGLQPANGSPAQERGRYRSPDVPRVGGHPAQQ
ncbi:hypothetical protein LV75_001574 [Actinokineospora diospyrosa]|uniref:MFS transporter n=1 Tax=Actinokineospora diospyrosa TaxID=103728 RepID=A0ABT1I9L0_9PSEU|nr:hypothetical protein [Actinokineospora diospyrosa]